jgi:hypothetical protein
LFRRSEPGRVSPMKIVWFMVTWLLAAVWAPASSHALLERAGMIHVPHADHGHGAGDDGDHAPGQAVPGSHEHGEDNHEAADGRCLISSAKPQLAKPVSSSIAPFLACGLAAIADGLCRCRECPRSGLPPPGPAPPELSQIWQFSSRAALPVRAPAFIF